MEARAQPSQDENEVRHTHTLSMENKKNGLTFIARHTEAAVALRARIAMLRISAHGQNKFQIHFILCVCVKKLFSSPCAVNFLFCFFK